jgi:nucleotide-binding universal stress UspA family protein
MSPHLVKLAPAHRRVFTTESPMRADLAKAFAEANIARRPFALDERHRALTFREIIVPLDGTSYAEHALPWGIHIAELAGGRVRLLHVHETMQLAFHPRRLQPFPEYDRLLREPMDKYIADVARRVARCSETPVTQTVVDVHDSTEGLADLVASTSDLVVMATRGRTMLSRTLLGSKLDAVVQRRAAPTLHVRGYACPVDLSARPSFRHALVPLDGTSESEDVLSSVAALSKLAGGRETLLRVVRSNESFVRGEISREDVREFSKNSANYLEVVASAWSRRLPRMQRSVVWSDASPAREILAEAAKREVDYIAMSTRPRGRLKRLFRPGVFDRLIRQTQTPILVVKQDGDVASAYR